MSDPIPAGDYGTATWQDFNHNWRKKDADWIQSRVVLRYDTTANRDLIPSPPLGMTIFNAQTDRLEVRVAGSGTPAWSGVYSVDGLIIKPVPTTTNVRLNHKDSASENGLIFSPNLITTQVPIVTAGDTLKFEASGLTISTGTKDAKLTTDATNLISDTPISAPGLISTGTFSAATVSTFVGPATAASTLTVTGLLTANGQIALPAPTATNHATTKAYVDGRDALYLPLVGGYLSGSLLVHQANAAAGGHCIRARAVSNNPYIDWMDWAGNQLAWAQATTTALTLWSKGDITLNSNGGQVRAVDAVYASGGFVGFRNGPVLTMIGTAHNVYQQWYGAGSSVDAGGSRYGWMGYNGSGHMQIRNEMSGGYIYMYSTYGGLIFVANNAERARFDTGGHFLIGMTAADQYTNVGVDMAVDGEIYSIISAGRNLNCNHISGADVNGTHFIRFSRHTSGVGIGSIAQNGTSGVLYNTTSDYRRKTIVGPITNAVERVMRLRPKRATFNDDEGRGEVDVFVAHEAAEVIPDAVSGEKDATDDDGNPMWQEMDYSKPTPLLAAAIQELAQRVTALEGAA